MTSDNEDNRFSARASRYVKVGTNVGSVAVKLAGQRLFGMEGNRAQNAADLAAALGGLKGPLMKVAQLLATIPDAVPAEYARELGQLQSQAPPMGPAFVRRRMLAELGPEWRARFAAFDETSTASASLGQVHRATSHEGRQLACKLQYPDMQSAVEADLTQLKLIFAVHARMDPGVDTGEIFTEIGARLREELDYDLEARHTRLYGRIFSPEHNPDGPRCVRAPEILSALSSKRLLTMTWLDGVPLLSYKTGTLEQRNAIAQAMFQAWWYPFSHFGVIHGDPHLGNYTVFSEGGQPAGINLLDYGCIRTFKPAFIQGVINLYTGLLNDDRDLVVHAYETWGFKGLTSELIDVLTIWARFIYGPLLDDRERTIAEGTAPGDYGRQEVFKVKTMLREKGPVTIPREFVFMDRAAIGLGGVFLHLDAKQNWYRMFNELIEKFDISTVEGRQREAFGASGVPLPV
jgi:predicted unusual protein kinase regulating ubiquinone biosynthesis (AarF/ABC1/UbiB family)